MAIHPGAKISCSGREGTLGLLVTPYNDRSKIFLLSCWHVIDGGMESVDVILPEHDNRVVARYVRSAATSSKEMDVALAEIVPGHGLPISNQLADGSRTISQAAYWDIGIDLVKYGAATGQTRCRLIDDPDQYGSLKYGLQLGQHPAGEEIYCAHGDSGAVWCNEAGKAVGLHSKGGLAGNFAAATPVKYILEDLGLTIL